MCPLYFVQVDIWESGTLIHREAFVRDKWKCIPVIEICILLERFFKFVVIILGKYLCEIEIQTSAKFTPFNARKTFF